MATQTISPKRQSAQLLDRNGLTETLPLGRRALVVQADKPDAKAMLLADIYSYLLARRQARLARRSPDPESPNAS